LSQINDILINFLKISDSPFCLKTINKEKVLIGKSFLNVQRVFKKNILSDNYIILNDDSFLEKLTKRSFRIDFKKLINFMEMVKENEGFKNDSDF
jgi:hypothetical protein